MARTKIKQSDLNTYPASGIAPLPVATSDAVGEFKVITASVGAALSLPAGGTWAWFGMYKADVGNTVSTISGGVAAGGTQIFAASTGNQPHAMTWRVA